MCDSQQDDAVYYLNYFHIGQFMLIVLCLLFYKLNLDFINIVAVCSSSVSLIPIMNYLVVIFSTNGIPSHYYQRILISIYY
jgi:hypothetical protein